MVKRIDLNCDMGEGFGAYTFGSDAELMKYITSANVACGGHAGDPNVMDQTVRLAKKHGVGVGAHPGFPDIAGFGRRMIAFSPEEIYRLVVWQIGGLMGFCTIHEVEMQHVKPHGALYNYAARNRDAAQAIAQAVFDVDSSLILFGLAGSELLNAGRAAGLTVASEVFADRTYQSDGNLTPRSKGNALIDNVDDAVKQVERMVRHREVLSVTGACVKLEADTVCIHGDGPNALRFVEKLRAALDASEIEIGNIGKQV